MQRQRRTRLVAVLPIAPTRRDMTVRPGRGVLLRFPDPSVDVLRNTAWDDLLTHADEAWTRRDRDSLTALAVCLVRVARDIVPEWTGL